ncbi:MAG: hypothetical protein JW751_00135 [Polyangiaceae bacterium]|nr:hypothetical protein [Polyangiaceae bacterium]
MATKTQDPELPSPAVRDFAIESMRVSLGDGEDDVDVEECGHQIRFRTCGVVYAILAATDIELVVDFRRPLELDEDLESKLGCYQELELPPGWLRYRERISRDPRPALEAYLGDMIERTQRELTLGERSPHDVIASAGRPIDCVPLSSVAAAKAAPEKKPRKAPKRG